MIARLWFLPIGYVLTLLVETPVLLLALSNPPGWQRRVLASLWLNACSYPVVVLLLPGLIADRFVYLAVAESFAPLCECVLFTLAYRKGRSLGDRSIWRDWAAIVLANLCSFGFGEWLFS